MRLFAFQSASERTYSTWLPSGEICGVAICGTLIRSMIVIGFAAPVAFAAAEGDGAVADDCANAVAPVRQQIRQNASIVNGRWMRVVIDANPLFPCRTS